ncbi:hypothetical protein [Planobispora rosea]|uniref:hypothetical protein n=1 Tax=Planobispora rosea TaxID=35762 RepID=UPI00167080C4|nr:hypothetical protein [Planobispora rosea]
MNVLHHLDDPVDAIGEAHRVPAPGGVFVTASPSRLDSPEPAHVWRPEPSSFDAEDAPRLVAEVFGRAETERWDAPLITLPDERAVRDYLIGRCVPSEAASAAATRVRTPITVTEKGAFVHGYR